MFADHTKKLHKYFIQEILIANHSNKTLSNDQSSFIFIKQSHFIIYYTAMILMILLSLLLLLTSFLGFKYYFFPKRLMKWQAQAFKRKGYKVLEMEYSLLSSSFIRFYMDRSKHDVFQMPKEYAPQYDIVIMNIFNHIIVEFTGAYELAQQLVSKENIFVYRKFRPSIQFGTVFVQEGLAFSEGEVWKKKRKVLNEVFNFDFIKALAPRIAHICDDVLDDVEKKFNVGEGEFHYDIKNYGVGVASTVMIKCFFGGKIEGEQLENINIAQYVIDLIDESEHVAFGFLSLLFGIKIIKYGFTRQHREFKRKLDLYKAWGRQVVKERIKKIAEKVENKQLEKSSNLIEALVMNQEKEGKENSIYDEQAIFDQFNTFFIAGTDTTSNFITTMIYLVCLHPEVEEKVRREIDEVMEQEDYSYENLKKCTYIDCVEKEVTRYYGPGFRIFDRFSEHDTLLKDVPIKKGVLLSNPTIGFHYSEKYYRNPRQFRPERWTQQCKNVPYYAIGGFSAGPRTCIGKHLALLESKIALIKFMKRYKKITLHKNDISEIKFIFGFNYKPSDFKSTLVAS